MEVEEPLVAVLVGLVDVAVEDAGAEAADGGQLEDPAVEEDGGHEDPAHHPARRRRRAQPMPHPAPVQDHLDAAQPLVLFLGSVWDSQSDSD